jgi:predicted PurR-regulated permease PerM
MQRVIDDSIVKIGGYVAGNLATSAICAICATIALAIIRVPFSVALGIWAGIADLVPAVGAYIGLIPAVAVAFSQGIADGVIVLAYFTAYQQVENYVIVPRVMQDAVDMSSVSVLIATLIGASLGGFAGALLAIPVAATLKVVIAHLSPWSIENERKARGGRHAVAKES